MVNNTYKGSLWFLLSKVTFALTTTMVKWFPYSTIQFNFIRACFIIMFVIPIFYFVKKRFITLDNPFLMLLRTLFGAAGLLCFFYTFKLMTFAKAVTIAASSAFLTPLFAVIFLGERVPLLQWVAVAFGYMGIWYALDPVYSGINWPEYVALINVILTSTVQVLSKKVLKQHDPFDVVFVGAFFMLFVGIVTLFSNDFIFNVLGSNVWVPLSFTNFLMLLFVLGPISFCAQYSYLKAFKLSTLSALMPLEHTSFVFAALCGYAFFNEIPSQSTFIAMGLIMIGVSLNGIVDGQKGRFRKRLNKKPK